MDPDLLGVCIYSDDGTHVHVSAIFDEIHTVYLSFNFITFPKRNLVSRHN